MARARNIKPSFFTNDELSELEPLARLLFIGIWTIADFKGCLEYKPKRIKVQLLPYDDCDIEKLTINLDKSGFISIYSVQGQLYVKVLNFDKHQNPHKNEREKGSDIPDIDIADFLFCEKSNKVNDLENIEINLDKNGTDHDRNETDRADSFNLIPSILNPDSFNTDSRNHETFVSSSDKPKRFCFKTSLLNLNCDAKLVDAFMAVRKTKKATNTEKAFELFIKKCNQSDLTLNQILEICIERDWKGFDVTWLKNQNTFNQPNNRMQEIEKLRQEWELNNEPNHTPY